MADFRVTVSMGLVKLTSDLSTPKWVMGHPCHELPSCQISASYMLSFSIYGSGMGQTCRRTDNGHQCIMPPPYIISCTSMRRNNCHATKLLFVSVRLSCNSPTASRRSLCIQSSCAIGQTPTIFVTLRDYRVNSFGTFSSTNN